MNRIFKSACVTLVLLFTMGCNQSPTTSPSASATSVATPAETHGHEDHHHDHAAPHGGTLIALGEHFAHLEILLDSGSGTVTVHVLDGEVESPIRLPGTPILMVLEGGETATLTPVANELTGETETDSATYRATVESLKGRDKFEATVKELDIKGSKLTDVKVNFPEGNESKAEEHGEHESHEEHGEHGHHEH